MRIYRVEDVMGKGFYSSGMFQNKKTHGHFHGISHPGTWSDPISKDYYLRDALRARYERKGISIDEWYYGFNSISQMKKWFMFNKSAWKDLRGEPHFVICIYKVHKAHTIAAKRQTVFLKEKATLIEKIEIKQLENMYD